MIDPSIFHHLHLPSPSVHCPLYTLRPPRGPGGGNKGRGARSVWPCVRPGGSTCQSRPAPAHTSRRVARGQGMVDATASIFHHFFMGSLSGVFDDFWVRISTLRIGVIGLVYQISSNCGQIYVAALTWQKFWGLCCFHRENLG